MSAPTSYAELAEVLDALPLLLREARRARGLTMDQAGYLIGCAASTVCRFENGEGLNLKTAVAILRWLDAFSPAAPDKET